MGEAEGLQRETSTRPQRHKVLRRSHNNWPSQLIQLPPPPATPPHSPNTHPRQSVFLWSLDDVRTAAGMQLAKPAMTRHRGPSWPSVVGPEQVRIDTDGEEGMGTREGGGERESGGV